MDYQKKVLVIEYDVPANPEEDVNTFEKFFNYDYEAMRERLIRTAKEFMASDENDIGKFFLRLVEDGKILPTDILQLAIQMWATPFRRMKQDEDGMLAALLKKIQEM